MCGDSARHPAPGGAANEGADTATAASRLLLDIVRRLRGRERGYLAGLLHDGPIQELAAAALFEHLVRLPDASRIAHENLEFPALLLGHLLLGKHAHVHAAGVSDQLLNWTSPEA